MPEGSARQFQLRADFNFKTQESSRTSDHISSDYKSVGKFERPKRSAMEYHRLVVLIVVKDRCVQADRRPLSLCLNFEK